MSYQKNSLISDQQKLNALLKAGLKPTALARLLEVEYRSVHRWLKDGVAPHPRVSKKIDELFRRETDLALTLEQLKKQVKDPLKKLQRMLETNDRALIELTYHSNAIEGSRLTFKETEKAVRGEIVRNKLPFEIFEAINHQNALREVLKQAKRGFKITEEFILKLHSIVMYNFHDKLPGSYRTGYVNLTNTEVPTLAAQLVPLRMKKLVAAMNRPGADKIALIAIQHHEFETIHPFFDGNGRTGRLVMMAQLLSRRYAPAHIRIDDQKDYYLALNKADRGDFKTLIHFLQESILRGYDLLS